MTFAISFTGTAAAQVEKVRKLARENDVTFAGNEQFGSFTGSGVVGNYKFISDHVVQVEILKKPFFARWSMVEAKINELFA